MLFMRCIGEIEGVLATIGVQVEQMSLEHRAGVER